MIQKMRERMGREEGFTLVELLVVMLILGILAAIAIPSFFNQRDKAHDASNKSEARTAETAMETYATDHGGAYAGATVSDLHAIESTLPDTGGSLAVTFPAGKAYEVSSTSSTGNVFNIIKNTDGTSQFTCTTPGKAGCPSGGNWAQ